MTIKFGRGKDKQKRKQRRKAIFGAIREQGRKDARTGEGASRQREALEGSLRGNAAYAAGRADVAVNRAKKKYGEVKTSLGERGAAALGKAKDFMGKAKSAASELTGKAKSAVSSGYSAVKEKAQDLLRKRKGGSAESYARAIEALEFEVAKQVGILEFASGRNYIEFAGWNPFQKKDSNRGKGVGKKEGLRKPTGTGVAEQQIKRGGEYRGSGVGRMDESLDATKYRQGPVIRKQTGPTSRAIKGGALAKQGFGQGSSLAIRNKGFNLGTRGKIGAALGTGAAVGGAIALGYKKGRGRDKQKRRRRSS